MIRQAGIGTFQWNSPRAFKGTIMSPVQVILPGVPGWSESYWIDAVCDQHEQELSAENSRLREYLAACPAERRERLLPELLWLEWEILGLRTSPDSPQAECELLPGWEGVIRHAWEQFQQQQAPTEPLTELAAQAPAPGSNSREAFPVGTLL